MNKTEDDAEFGVPDAENPERTDADFLWAVRSADFGGFLQAHAFLTERETFLRRTEEAGIPRAAFLPLSPRKPGFLERAAEMLEDLAKSARHAAE